jgi:hypothetical protein
LFSPRCLHQIPSSCATHSWALSLMVFGSNPAFRPLPGWSNHK